MRFTLIKNDNNISIPGVYYDFLPPGGTIGRSIDNTLVLTDENRTISRLQAIVHISVDGTCHIVNKGTVSPLYLNGTVIEKDVKIKVNHGDRINIAKYTILVSDPAVNESTFTEEVYNQGLPLQEQNIKSSHNGYQSYLDSNVKQTQHTDSKIPLTTNDELLLDNSVLQADFDIKNQTNINAEKTLETTSITEISTEQLTTDIAITDATTQENHNVINIPNVITLTDIPDHDHSSETTEIKNDTTSSIKSDIHAISVNTSFLAGSVGEKTIMTNKTSKPNISVSNTPDDQSVSNTEEDIPREIWDDLLSEFSATEADPQKSSQNTQAQSLYQNDTIMAYNEQNINSRDPLSQLEVPLELSSLKQQTQDVSTLFNESATITNQPDIFNPTPTTLIAESASENTIPGITNAQPVTSTLTENLKQPLDPVNHSSDLTMGQSNNTPIDDPLSLFSNNNISRNHTDDPFDILNNAAPLAQVETDTASTTVFPEQAIPIDPYVQKNAPSAPTINTLSGAQTGFAADLVSPTMPHSPLSDPLHDSMSTIDNGPIQQHLSTNPTQAQYHDVNTQHLGEEIRSQTQYQQSMQPNSAQKLMMQSPIEGSRPIPSASLQDQQQQYQQDLQQQALQQQALQQQALQQQTLHQQTLQQQTLQQQALQQQSLQQQPLQQQPLQQQPLQQQPLQQQSLQQQSLQQQSLQQQSLQQQALQQQILQSQQLQQSYTQKNVQQSINPQSQFSPQPNNNQPYLNSTLPLSSLDQQQPDIFQAAQANQPPQQTMPYSESKMATMPSSASQINMDNNSRPFRKIKGVNNKRLDINPVKSSVPNVQINTEHVLQDDMLNALLEGIGLSDMNPHPVFDAERVKLLGRLVSVYFQGTIALLQSRNILKDFIISNDDRTMILEEANNPFKLLPTGKTVLMQMFGSPMPGFMEPEQAVMDALIDLQAHQLGMIAGIRAIIAAMLQTFNPDKIEADAKQKDSLPVFSLSWRKKAALWDLYVKNYHKVAGEIDDDFITHFGDAFSLAYKVEVEQYKQAQKKRDKQ